MYNCKRIVNACHFQALTPVDYRSYNVTAAQDYGVNECGFIRSDFEELNERQDPVSLMRTLSRMQAMEESNEFDGLTDEQKFNLIRPRGMQTPAELDRFEQYCLDEGIKFMRTLHDSDVAKLSVGNNVGEGVDVKSTD